MTRTYSYCMVCGFKPCKCPNGPPKCLRCGTINWNCDCGRVPYKPEIKMTPKPKTSSSLFGPKPKAVIPHPIHAPVPRPAPKGKPSTPAIAGGEDSLPTALQQEGTGTRIYVQIGKTIKLEDYQALRVDFGQSEYVAPGVDVEDAKKTLAASVAETLKDMIEMAETEFKS